MNPSVGLLGKRGWQIILALCLEAAPWSGFLCMAAPKQVPAAAAKVAATPAQDLQLQGSAERKAGALAAFIQGSISEENADADSALEYFQKALALDASNSELAVKVAGELVKRGRTADAISILKDTVKALPKAHGPVQQLALIYQRELKKPEQALKYALEAIALDPGDFASYLCAYEIYAESGETNKAEQILRRAEAVNRQEPEFWLQMASLYARLYASAQGGDEQSPERAAKVDTLLKQALELAKEDPLFIAKVGDFQSLLQKPKEAIALYARALKLGQNSAEPAMLEVREKLVRSYLSVGESDKAVAALRELIKINPLGAGAYQLLADIYLAKGDYQNALAQNQQLLLLDASQPVNYIRVADLYLRLKEAPKAIELLGEAHNKFPEAPQVTYTLALALSQAKRHSQALTLFQVALHEAELNAPQILTAAFYFAYGAAAEQAGEIEKSAQLLKKAIELEPNEAASACNYLGYMWTEHGIDLEQAAHYINRALAAEPKNPAYLDSMGWNLFKRGEPAKALEYLEQAERLMEAPDPEVHEHLGEVYESLQNKEQALIHWKKALELNPEKKGELGRKIESLGP